MDPKVRPRRIHIFAAGEREDGDRIEYSVTLAQDYMYIYSSPPSIVVFFPFAKTVRHECMLVTHSAGPHLTVMGCGQDPHAMLLNNQQTSSDAMQCSPTAERTASIHQKRTQAHERASQRSHTPQPIAEKIHQSSHLLSGIAPSTTATAPTLPPSADPLSSAIAEITSWGSSRCQVAMVCLELAPTVQAKTCSLGRREARRERNMSVRFCALVWLHSRVWPRVGVC